MIRNSSIPVAMILFGLLWKEHPPKSINVIYGYRTSMSMKNDKTWKFAHLYLAKIWFWSGIILLAFSTMFMLFFRKDYERIPGWIILIEITIMILSIIPTELALLRRFNKNGELK